jgi:hypothetical protein
LLHFQNPGNSRLSPLPPEPAGFNYGHDATIDIPIDSSTGGKNYKVVEYPSYVFPYAFGGKTIDIDFSCFNLFQI